MDRVTEDGTNHELPVIAQEKRINSVTNGSVCAV